MSSKRPATYRALDPFLGLYDQDRSPEAAEAAWRAATGWGRGSVPTEVRNGAENESSADEPGDPEETG